MVEFTTFTRAEATAARDACPQEFNVVLDQPPDQLPAGAFGFVLLGWANEQRVAVKVQRNMNEALVRHEAKILGFVKDELHPHVASSIPRFIGSAQSCSWNYIAMSAADGQEWLQVVLDLGPDKWQSEEGVARIFADILVALCCLHALGVMHLDVKLENILIGKDGRWQPPHPPARLCARCSRCRHLMAMRPPQRFLPCVAARGHRSSTTALPASINPAKARACLQYRGPNPTDAPSELIPQIPSVDHNPKPQSQTATGK